MCKYSIIRSFTDHVRIQKKDSKKRKLSIFKAKHKYIKDTDRFSQIQCETILSCKPDEGTPDHVHTNETHIFFFILSDLLLFMFIVSL